MKETQKKQATISEKKDYSSPQFSVFGSITEMTNSNKLSQANDSSGGGSAGSKGRS